MTYITSASNAKIRHIARLGSERKYRRTTGEFVGEGIKLLEEALESGVQLTAVLMREDEPLPHHIGAQIQAQGAAIYAAPPALLAQVSGLTTPQSVIFCAVQPTHSLSVLNTAQRMVLLEGIQDPGNLGTILRTADAFGVDGVMLCEGCVDRFSPKVVRATMGALFRLPLLSLPLTQAAAWCKIHTLPLYAAALEADSLAMDKVDMRRAAVLIGNEGKGISAQGLALADKKIIIPMSGRAQSLNAAVAASILIYEMTHR